MFESEIMDKLHFMNSIISNMNHIKVARDTLGYLQYKNVMTNFLFQNASSTSSNYDEIFATPCFEKKLISFKTACEQEEEHKDKTPIPSAKSEQIVDEFYDVLGEEEGMYYRMATSIEKEDLSDLPENNWSGYFKGYSILHEKQEFCINENKKCIELTDDMGACDLDEYLRSGIRCFVIDLFSGTIRENQSAILRLNQSELRISEEYGFPIICSVCVKLSPRLQYSGILGQTQYTEILNKGDQVILTTNRKWSTRTSSSRIYVNAMFLLSDIEICDFILIGQDIQIQVNEIFYNSLKCTVVIGGVLKSRMPVLFPSRCNKFRMSYEELQDITFAKEVGARNIISYIPGTPEYLEDLKEALKLLECSHFRLGCRIVLNEVKGCGDDLNWILCNYDGFLLEINYDEELHTEEQILQLCPAAEWFMISAYESKKPIILDPKGLAENKILVHPSNFFHIYMIPDKYVFNCHRSPDSFYFYWLQSARFDQMPQYLLGALPYGDKSYTGSDSLARACVTAAYEMNAKVILVLCTTGRMAIKLSHFRPNVPIIFVTNMKSACDFISFFHNIVILYFASGRHEKHELLVYKQFILGLLCAKKRGIIKHDDNVLFVYGKEPGISFPDKYVVYKFDEVNSVDHLSDVLFAKQVQIY